MAAEISERARKARNAYQREWYRKNKDKERKRLNEYWERKAEQMEKEGKI